MAEPTLAEKVIRLDQALAGVGLAHAFGGALALAYYAEPRATADIDLNIFAAPDCHDMVSRALVPFGVDTDLPEGAVSRDGQARVWWGRTALDLFYEYDPFHQAMRTSVRVVPFGSERIPILAPEHLIVCKAVFARAKDWLDIEQVLTTVQDLDTKELGTWMDRLAGPGDHRSQRLAAMVAELTALQPGSTDPSLHFRR